MSADVTACFYLLLGVCVAVALWMNDAGSSPSSRSFRSLSAVVFWPLYLPLLLTSPRTPVPDTVGLTPELRAPLPADEMATAIYQVEGELEAALSSLKGWADDVLASETDRLAELRSAWRLHADRVRQLDRLLGDQLKEVAHPIASSINTVAQDPIIDGPHTRSATLISTSERSRLENLSKLGEVRKQLHDNLLATLAWVRQLITMIHLARYTGAPASRAAELVQQIANSAEGLSGYKR